MVIFSKRTIWCGIKNAKMAPRRIVRENGGGVKLAVGKQDVEFTQTFSPTLTKPNAGLQLAQLGRLTVFDLACTTQTLLGNGIYADFQHGSPEVAADAN